jgi:hypothetical protein
MISVGEYKVMRDIVNLAIQNNERIDDVNCGSFNIDAVKNLHDQMMITYLKASTRRLESMKYEIADRVANGESLRKIARLAKINPYKVAKCYLETVGTLTVAKVQQDPSTITDPRIRHEVLCCIAEDPICSVEHSLVQECMGREYEELLISCLSNLHLCFETEAELRARGKPKTPDILFLIPMTISVEYGGAVETQTFVVIWIDSKAMFAGPDTYNEHSEQFKGYTNRYGRGLVIYWHGFVENVIPLGLNDNVVVTDRFPAEWIYPTGKRAAATDSTEDFQF